MSLPAGENAQLVASTLNGEVHVGSPIDGSTESRRMHGEIGHGGRQLRLRTVNGKIDVKAAG